MNDTREIEERLRALTAEVEQLRRKVAGIEGDAGGEGRRSDRRGFLKLGAGAALGALGLAASKVLPAAAADAGPLLIGTANLGESPTTLTGDVVVATGPPNPVLAVVSQNTTFPGGGAFNGTLRAESTSAVNAEGVDGWAGGTTAFAVYGLTDHGFGVVGESTDGIALYARRSGRILQEPLVAAGAPGYLANNFEQVRDANGILWINSTHGTLGTPNIGWRRINSLRFDAADGSGTLFKPFRLVDTRNLGAPRGAGTYSHTIAPSGAGASAIPADAVGVVGNLTAVGYSSAGYLAIIPAGVAFVPGTDPSSVNFLSGQVAIANSFVVGIGSGGQVSVVVTTPGTSHYIIDIAGYIQSFEAP